VPICASSEFFRGRKRGNAFRSSRKMRLFAQPSFFATLTSLELGVISIHPREDDNRALAWLSLIGIGGERRPPRAELARLSEEKPS